MKHLLSQPELALLDHIAEGQGLLRTADEQALAVLCRHYMAAPASPEYFGITSTIRMLCGKCRAKPGYEPRLIAIAERLTPVDPTPLMRPYESAA